MNLEWTPLIEICIYAIGYSKDILHLLCLKTSKLATNICELFIEKAGFKKQAFAAILLPNGLLGGNDIFATRLFIPGSRFAVVFERNSQLPPLKSLYWFLWSTGFRLSHPRTFQ